MNNIRVEPMDKGGFRLAIIGPLVIGFLFVMWMAFTSAVDAENLAVKVEQLRAEISINETTMAALGDRLIALQEAVTFTGIASFYGVREHGNITASGTIFDKDEISAASPWLPFGSVWRVTREDTGAFVTVTITDRGPAIRLGRVIDLSEAAARKIGMLDHGVVKVQIRPEVGS
jgi:rare lipoprotein A